MSELELAAALFGAFDRGSLLKSATFYPSQSQKRVSD
jgi:hypothetical protein